MLFKLGASNNLALFVGVGGFYFIFCIERICMRSLDSRIFGCP